MSVSEIERARTDLALAMSHAGDGMVVQAETRLRRVLTALPSDDGVTGHVVEACAHLQDRERSEARYHVREAMSLLDARLEGREPTVERASALEVGE